MKKKKKKSLPANLQLEIALKPVFEKVRRLVHAQLEKDGFFKAVKEFEEKRERSRKKYRKQFEKELRKRRKESD